MKRSLLAPVLGLVVVCWGCGVPDYGVPDYDKPAYERRERAILQSTNMLAGIPLTQASKLLSLEGVPWDKGYCNMPLSQARIYHFRGFSLNLVLEVRPPGIAPGSTQSFSWTDEAQLGSTGVWWVASFWPQLEIDRLNDPRTRMSNYWDNLHASFRRRPVVFRRALETKVPAVTNR